MKKQIVFILMSVVLCAACRKDPAKPAAAPAAPAAEQGGPAAPSSELRALPGQEVKEALPGGGWFTWKFSEKPKLGTLIVKVQVFNKDGSRNAAYKVAGETGMPSMRAHDAAAEFVKNKKGDYLMPFDVVMPGEWQVVIRISQENKEIYAAKVLFSV